MDTQMKCPKCGCAMEAIKYNADIEVQRCIGCVGLYSDLASLGLMRDDTLVDKILDTGSKSVGARHNDMQDTQCPRCCTIMERLEDSEKARVILDVCHSCDGVFLDAGELTDLKHISLMDRVRKLLAIL
ncbi:MAG: zf-TFIIB domain-containing protein [Halioglobus sp.]